MKTRRGSAKKTNYVRREMVRMDRCPGLIRRFSGAWFKLMQRMNTPQTMFTREAKTSTPLGGGNASVSPRRARNERNTCPR